MAVKYTSGGYLSSGSSNDVLVATGGSTHLDGGAGSDNLNGGASADILQGGRGNDFIWGGGGNDTFLFIAADLDGSTDKIFDFEGAGVDSGDRLTFYGLGEGSTFTQYGSVLNGVNGHKIYSYDLYDTATNIHNYISIESTNGNALNASDYAFYGSVALV
jgi:Ca2+-binding RTX toxin-like protein